MYDDERTPIGELLLKLGYINRAQLTEALEFQQRLPPGSYQRLGEIFVSFGYINQTGTV